MPKIPTNPANYGYFGHKVSHGNIHVAYSSLWSCLAQLEAVGSGYTAYYPKKC